MGWVNEVHMVFADRIKPIEVSGVWLKMKGRMPSCLTDPLHVSVGFA